jgi:hypothetical protein
MRLLNLLLLVCFFSSCWIKESPPTQPDHKVWGNKPVYGVDSVAKKIVYSNTPETVAIPGNIYVKDNYLFQVEIGRGIHIIDKTTPSLAHRIGFITINGSSQVSIKNNYLYSNSYDDLVVIDISDLNDLHEVKRVAGAFPEGRYDYYYSEPIESGYYECAQYDSLVVSWRKDSVWSYGCYKN